MATREEVERTLGAYEPGPDDPALADLMRGHLEAPGASVEPAGPFPATDGDTWTGPWPDREWLIPGWLPVGRLGMLSGRGGRGKSRLALQLVARMAASPAARGPFVPAARGPGNDTAVSDANLALDATHAGRWCTPVGKMNARKRAGALRSSARTN